MPMPVGLSRFSHLYFHLCFLAAKVRPSCYNGVIGVWQHLGKTVTFSLHVSRKSRRAIQSKCNDLWVTWIRREVVETRFRVSTSKMADYVHRLRLDLRKYTVILWFAQGSSPRCLWKNISWENNLNCPWKQLKSLTKITWFHRENNLNPNWALVCVKSEETAADLHGQKINILGHATSLQLGA